jgi:muscarinic acetylcholine receptor M3
MGQPVDDISKLPLDARLVPKQLVRIENNSLSPQVTALNVAGAAKKTPKTKKTSEKKQDRKAAKTLSAILFAFIVTWTPYSVLVVLNGMLGKKTADEYIPLILWQFSYYLCYINSTINPVLYALCNASFRQILLRINNTTND